MAAHADVTETIESDGTPRRDVGYEINDGILQSILRDRDYFRTWGDPRTMPTTTTKR